MDDQPVERSWQEPTPPVVQAPAPVSRASQAPVARPLQPAEPLVPGDPAEFDERPGDDDDFEPTRRRRWPFIVFLLLVLGAIIVVLPFFMARRVFNSVERVPVAEVLTPPLPDGTNILLVGTDSRAGIDASTENAGAIIGGDEVITGERTDTIMILRIEEESSKFLSLPRDLWLPINGGDPQRINTAFGQGPASVINTVQSELGIPISHYVQVDIAGFIDLVDAVGGVDITIPHPAFDRASGLDLPQAGTVTLDSTQALAFVRSRFYVEVVDGVERKDLTSDLGRVQRQQEFMRALMLRVAEQRNPTVVNDMANSIADAIVMDDATSFRQAFDIANSLRSMAPESVVLPTTPDRIGGRDVLVLTNEAPPVLAQFGG